MSTAAKVGIITLIGLIALGAVITWKTNLFLTRTGYVMVGSFRDVEGLSIGAEVRYRGFNAGKVIRIDPGPEDIKVYALLKEGIKFPADSHLRVAYDGIVGLKFLEIRPGTSPEAYESGVVLKGISTAGIVDFVDIGSKNLEESKRILESVRLFVEDPKFKNALTDVVLTTKRVAENAEKLTEELRVATTGIKNITADPEFQRNVKGTVQETHKTLSSANSFFESFGRINFRPSADLLFGSEANFIRGNIDVVQGPKDYLRFGIGEGPVSRDLGLYDVQVSRGMNPRIGMRLGMINSRIGGGIDYDLSEYWTFSTDIYDINNPKPNWPKLRLTSSHSLSPFTDLSLQIDDALNQTRNYLFGVTVKGGM